MRTQLQLPCSASRGGETLPLSSQFVYLPLRRMAPGRRGRMRPLQHHPRGAVVGACLYLAGPLPLCPELYLPDQEGRRGVR